VVTRKKILEITPTPLWDIVSDPWQFPRWWPGVVRVEQVDGSAWTKVFRSSKQKLVRADFSSITAQPPSRFVFEQHVEGSAFGRVLSSAITEISLAPEGDGQTAVELSMTRRLRGLARLGTPIVRRATAKQLNEALENLTSLVQDQRD
jgi:carbon monoxide dehydrogenase subunit G